jgi:integrase
VAGSKKKKRRIRSPHPGVVLIQPDDGHPYWRARIKDPDTGRMTKVRIDPVANPTAEKRRDWAILKSKALAKRKDDLESGAPRATGTPMGAALDRYFSAHPNLRPKTITVYKTAATKLQKWGKKAGVSVDNLTRAHLLGFREHLVCEPKRVSQPRGKRGSTRAAKTPRSAASVNRELRAVRTILGYLRDLDLFPKLPHDDMRRALKRLPSTFERKDFLKPAECQKLLEAALRHDADTFAATREEHALRRGDRATREAPVNETARHEPIAPFTALMLITGMRLGEALGLTWKQVDLTARDHDDRQVGEIYLRGSESKTHKARTVDLEVSPALRVMLAALLLASEDKSGSVFGLSEGAVQAAAKRLRQEYGAPEKFNWQMLRATTGTYLTNAPGIFGAASAYRSAKQLGHSVGVAEKHYVGLIRVHRDARTLEAAMQLEPIMARVVASVSGARRSVEGADEAVG